MCNQLTGDKVKAFALAGNAVITLQSGKTGIHYTYKITQHENRPDLYFVRLLSGPDNNDDYQYIGCYYSDNGYFNPCKTWKSRLMFSWPPALRAIQYFFDNIDNVPDNLFVFHEGKCGRCGRRLTTPESIERGIGPECIKVIS